ncbi:MAG TPA: hypothetical protein VEX66_04075 [Microlunatus sp.]|nr:hypothetical protein [Microlunatus sp.]
MLISVVGLNGQIDPGWRVWTASRIARGDLVGVDRRDRCGVEDGSDRDGGVGVGEPAAELVQGDRSVGGAEHPVLVDQGLVGDVDVHHHLGAAAGELGGAVGAEVEGGAAREAGTTMITVAIERGWEHGSGLACWGVLAH